MTTTKPKVMTTMTDSQTLPVPPALRRGERRRWLIVVATVLLIGWLVFQYVSQAAISAKTDRALKEQTATAQQAQAAATAAQHATDCLNTLLAARGPLTNADTNAEVDIFSCLIGVLIGDPKDQARLYATFLIESRKDLAVLEKDKTFRDTHPLGQC